MSDFQTWLQAVDAEIQRRVGLTHDDIDDWRYRDDFERKVPPKRCAARAIRNARDAMGM